MDRGARETLVTMSGYVVVAIAILVALGVAGLEFSNLAIIAGALSVGIGFGLQNIVNNFVSGLILLFERPVKTGDWIVVGSTEGYVKRISIRSTQIETFDRADVIVPNSELISGQVTNWMLRDVHGRARVPIGVAYGSDTEKVKNLLLEVARAHPDVITDGTYPEPRVLFLNFGDSSLNFELRCHVQNVDRRLSVISELNFAIDAAFRANGIEIPFPQRDLHVRDWPAKGLAPDQPAAAD
jgi:small-conductance mechanosensitive channel